MDFGKYLFWTFVYHLKDREMTAFCFLLGLLVTMIRFQFASGEEFQKDDMMVSFPECNWPLYTGLVKEATPVMREPNSSFARVSNSLDHEAQLLFAVGDPSYSFADTLRGPTFVEMLNRAMFHFAITNIVNSDLSALLPCGSSVNMMFRTIDGSCNHVNNLGQVDKALARFLPPAYADGQNSPRQFSVEENDERLPSARVVSRVVHPDKKVVTGLTIFVMQWGQFIDHECVSTPFPIEDTRGTIKCCDSDAEAPDFFVDGMCFPIIFPEDDPDFRGTCMEFVRSEPITDDEGNISLPRENRNIVTSFIDASTVYGSTKERLARVRDPSNKHLLKTTPDNFLPDNGLEDCVKRGSSDICHLAGDARVNEQPALTLIHALFLRYHNYLATELKRVSSPGADPELIFQQARAIVGAAMQNILYAEWMPIVLGPSVRHKFGLDFTDSRTQYNSNRDPRVFQAFSTAVFRFGHTLIPRSLPIRPGYRPELRRVFFSPFEARENVNNLTMGILLASDSEDRSQDGDPFIVKEVTAHLFENQEGERRAFDLVALNIQRGRDHGLPGYNEYRKKLGLGKVSDFDDSALGTRGEALESVYEEVDDIDLFSGGMSEPVFDGGLVGETFSHLMASQFHNLKYGDRFFFDNERLFYGFTDRQVRLLRTIRLSHILCLTTQIPKAQRNAFRVPGAGNEMESCAKLISEHPSMSEFKNYPKF